MLRSFSPFMLLLLLSLGIGFLVSMRNGASPLAADADRFAKWGMLLLAALLVARAAGASLGALASTVELIISVMLVLWAVTWVWLRVRQGRA
jgi:hypothetical protein